MSASEQESATAGQQLRRAREERGLDLETIARQTRIKRDFLEALEEDRLEVFPGSVYARAFLREYAAFLGLDDAVLASSVPAGEPEPGASDTDRSEDRGRFARVAAAVLLAIVMVAGAAVLRQRGGNAEPPSPPAPSQAVTAPAQVSADIRSPSPVGVRLRIRAEDRCWVRVRSGDQLLYEGTLQPGQSLHFASREPIVLRAGNAGALRVRVNEREEEPLGAIGQVITRAFEPVGASDAGEGTQGGERGAETVTKEMNG